MTMALASKQEKTFKIGSVRKIGDRVCYLYLDDEDGREYAYGEVTGKLDEDTAIVKVVLQGRRKKMVSYEHIPFSQLMPHIPDTRRRGDGE